MKGHRVINLFSADGDIWAPETRSRASPVFLVPYLCSVTAEPRGVA